MATGLFEDQRVCVVGGTAGIGLAIAREAALEDANVTIAGRSAGKAAEVAAHIGMNVDGRVLDITDSSSVERFFAELGPVDHLVVTAAQVHGGPFRTGSLDDARRSVEGKFWSQYLCARHGQVSRSILLFSGTLSRRPRPGLSIVSAVNGAVEALGRALAVELAPVRVNVLSPGLIRGTDAYASMPAQAQEAMYAAAAERLPARLVGDADSVARIAVSLLASPYVTGAVFDVDGGGLVRMTCGQGPYIGLKNRLGPA